MGIMARKLYDPALHLLLTEPMSGVNKGDVRHAVRCITSACTKYGERKVSSIEFSKMHFN